MTQAENGYYLFYSLPGGASEENAAKPTTIGNPTEPSEWTLTWYKLQRLWIVSYFLVYNTHLIHTHEVLAILDDIELLITVAYSWLCNFI